MFLSISEIKKLAKIKLKRKHMYVWKGLVLLFLFDIAQSISIQYLDMNAASMRILCAVSMLFTFIISPLRYGTIHYLLDFASTAEAKMKTLFIYYKDIVKLFVLVVFINIICAFGLMCFILPGIVLWLGLMLVPYVYPENKELDILELIKLSWGMMKGYKIKALLFECSYILWYIFILVTMGIGFIFVYPYISVSRAIYYNQIMQTYYAENMS